MNESHDSWVLYGWRQEVGTRNKQFHTEPNRVNNVNMVRINKNENKQKHSGIDLESMKWGEDSRFL